MISSSNNLEEEEEQGKITKNSVDEITNCHSDDDDDDDQVSKSSRVLLGDHFRSNSVKPISKRAEKDESKKPEQFGTCEEQVGDIVRLGKKDYFIVDIFEKEIMELGDKVDLNYVRFNKFEVVSGGPPRDHHYFQYRCCYSSWCCVCSSSNVEGGWKVLERELASRDGSKEVTFFVRTYQERKELMRVAVTVNNGGDQSHSLYFFDIKFPSDYPNREPSFFYHQYGLPLSTPEYLRPWKHKLVYNILDVFLHIEEIVLMNTKKSCHQMLDMLRKPLLGFEDFVKGHFRKRGAFILRDMMEEMDLDKERERNMFVKIYVAFEDNGAYCEHLLSSDLKDEIKRYREKEKERTPSRDYYNYSSPSPSHYLPVMSRFDDIKKTSRLDGFLKIFL